MACIGSSRLCAHVEKLCQFGHFTQLRRKVSTTTCAKSRPVLSRTSGALLQRCQVRKFTVNSYPLFLDLAEGLRLNTSALALTSEAHRRNTLCSVLCDNIEKTCCFIQILQFPPCVSRVLQHNLCPAPTTVATRDVSSCRYVKSSD